MNKTEEQLCICLNYPGQTLRCPIEKHQELFEKYAKEFDEKNKPHPIL